MDTTPISPSARAEALSYKLRKEAFVSNLTGSSLTDINLVTLVAASAVLLWTALSKQQLIGWPSDTSFITYAIDFLLNVCAILFAFTIYSSVPLFLNLALVVPAVIALLLPTQQRPKRPAKASKQPRADATNGQKTKPGDLIVRPFLTNYRGAMLIATILAILAVDFPIFPRRFAKVETWGTSLMDLGVGSFVFSNGIVSARTVIREQQNGRKGNVLGRLVVACRHSVPLFVLGIVRLVSVKNLEYAEHVTEYGVHWNFFFTLGLLPPFVESVDSLLAAIRGSTATSASRRRSIRYDVVALLIALVYEVVLNNTGLLSFILIAPRTPDSDLLTKNREGVFSFFGYLAVFLSGRSTGTLVCQFQDASNAGEHERKSKKSVPITEQEAKSVSVERRQVILPALLIRAVIFATFYFVTTSVYAANLTVSRRLANMSYVLWVLAYNNAQLVLFALTEELGLKFVFSRTIEAEPERYWREIVQAREVASPVMQAFNKNGLAIFLVANLGTGVVNLTINTLDMSNVGAMWVLMAYAGILTAVAVSLHRSGVQIKL